MLTQTVWLEPAKDVPGEGSTWMLTVEVLEVQTPLVEVQPSTTGPATRPVTVVLLKVGAVMLAVPLTTDQLPVPTEIAFPFNVVLGVEMQRL